MVFWWRLHASTWCAFVDESTEPCVDGERYQLASYCICWVPSMTGQPCEQ